MPSKREQVISAIVDLVRGAMPQGAKVLRNRGKPEEIPSAGYANVTDGEPGEPEITLNPTTYIFDHHVMVTVAAKSAGLTTADQALDALLIPIGTAILSDPTLGGLCDYLMATAPSVLLIDGAGAPASRQADFAIVATYSTSNPLT